jgi:hypothetical protein
VVAGTLGDQLELVVAQPRRVARGDLAAAEHLQRHFGLGQQPAQPSHSLGQFEEVHLPDVRRRHDAAGPVLDGQPGELHRLAVVARSIVDARQEMEVEFGAHLVFRLVSSLAPRGATGGCTARTQNPTCGSATRGFEDAAAG